MLTTPCAWTSRWRSALSRRLLRFRRQPRMWKPTTPAVGQVIEAKTIVDQPLVNRSYVDLMGLQAGVNVSTGTGTVSGDLSAGNVSVSGARTDANGFTVNGGNVEEEEGNGTSIIPNADSIAEFKIITNSANAEYGHFSGGAVSVITKSGSNSFHGDGFEFWRNQNLDAITPFASTKGPYNHNQYGGTFGRTDQEKQAFLFRRLAGQQGNHRRAGDNASAYGCRADGRFVQSCGCRATSLMATGIRLR